MMNVLRVMGNNLWRSPVRSAVFSREESGRFFCSGTFKSQCSKEPPENCFKKSPKYCFRLDGNPILNGWDAIEPLYPNIIKIETSSTIVDNKPEAPKDSSDTGE